MKIIHITTISIRIIGFIFLLKTIFAIPIYFDTYIQLQNIPNVSFAIIFYSFLLISQFVLSLIIIKFPFTLAKMFLPPTYSEIEVQSADRKAFELAAFTVLGLYVLTWAIPDFVEHGIVLTILNSSDNYDHTKISKYAIMESMNFIRLCLGFYFLLGASNLGKLLDKLRA